MLNSLFNKNKNFIALSDLDILLNPEILKQNLTIPNFKIEDFSQLQENKENFQNGNLYKFKEKILYNNLQNEIIKNLNIDCSNLFSLNYNEKYFDFETENFYNFFEMKQKFLEELFINNNQEEKILEKVDDIFIENKDKKEKIDYFKLLNESLDILKEELSKETEQLQINNNIKNILKIIDNNEFKIENENLIKLECNIGDIIDLFEKNYIKKNINNFVVSFINEFEIISLKLKSIYLFLKILKILKNYKIFIKNFQYLNKFFDLFQINKIIDIKKDDNQIIINGNFEKNF